MEFVSCLRITRARELLLREDLNISMVALEVGYNDASTFIRHFKKLTGLRPSDYKKSSNKMPSQPHG
jgi:AraC-like DNA-binding protein